jgi:ATP/maltotriose-dependent transcriptional regulator MalT
LGDAATLVGAYELAMGFCAASLTDLRAQGRLGLVARARATQAWSALHLADLSTAIPAVEEAGRLARETSQPLIWAIARAVESMITALRGDQDRAEVLAEEAEKAAMPVAANAVLASVQLARGLSALGGGRHADAYEHLYRMHDPADPAFHRGTRWFARGRAHRGRSAQWTTRDTVREIVEEVEKQALKTPSPALHAGLRYARALLADDSDAERFFQEALGADLRRFLFLRARTQLAYAQWLRRQRRVAESRAPPRAARETFDALGTIPWNTRARQELRASGETSRRRTPDARDRLTPQERQVAQMAADGLTNREIGGKLYLSHRTVSSHLHRIFPTLGVTSRFALRTAVHGDGKVL